MTVKCPECGKYRFWGWKSTLVSQLMAHLMAHHHMDDVKAKTTAIKAVHKT